MIAQARREANPLGGGADNPATEMGENGSRGRP